MNMNIFYKLLDYCCSFFDICLRGCPEKQKSQYLIIQPTSAFLIKRNKLKSTENFLNSSDNNESKEESVMENLESTFQTFKNQLSFESLNLDNLLPSIFPNSLKGDGNQIASHFNFEEWEDFCILENIIVIIYRLSFKISVHSLEVTVSAEESGECEDHKVLITLMKQNKKSISDECKFNETKVFSGIKEADLKKLTLNIKIFNFNMTNDSRIIGEVLYPLSLLAECENEGNKKEIIFEKNITPFKDITSFLGLLLVSLYLDINKEEFVVSIIKGKDLKAIDRNNLTNPYCILKLGTSVSKLGNKKTSIKYKTLNPIWNQSFKFQVTKKDFDNNLTLKIKVLDKDPVESNVIGEIIFSSEGSLNAAHHWNSMIDNKMKPVSEWHTLKSCN